MYTFVNLSFSEENNKRCNTAPPERDSHDLFTALKFLSQCELQNFVLPFLF